MRQKKWKSAVSILLMMLMMILCVTGCGTDYQGADGENSNGQQAEDSGNAQKENSGKGRFVESEIVLPKGISSVYDMKVLENGTWTIIALNSEQASFCQYISEDKGETWNTRNLETHGYLAGAVLLSDGGLVEIIEAAEASNTGGMKNHKYTLYHVAADNTEHKIEVSFPEMTQEEVDALILQRAAATEDGRLLMQDFKGKIYQMDMESGEASVLCDLEGVSTYFGMAGDRICAVAKNGIVLCDSTTGEQLESDTFLDNVIKEKEELAKMVTDNTAPLIFGRGMEADSLLYVTHDGIFYHSYGGSVSEQLVNGALTSLSDPSAGFKKVQMLDEETILLMVWDSSGNWKLLSYTYDSSVSAVPETELTVYALEDSKLLRQAVIACQKNYPDIYVNVQIGRSGDDSVTTEDALRTLNTEILAGKGADVLLLDGMPVDSYVEKGILADISNVAEEINETSGLFENIYKAYQKDGAVYELPARFYPAIIEGEKESVAAGATLSGLADYGVERKEAGAKFVFSYKSPTGLLERLYALDASRWTDKGGRLDAEKISNWLTIAQKIYEVDIYGEQQELVDIGGDLKFDLKGEVSAFSILSKECEIEFGSIRGMDELISICSVNDTLGEAYDYDIVNRDGAKVFMPYGLAGIVNTTEHRQEAEQFLLTLFGTECGSIDGGGFPINCEAYENLCEAAQHKFSSTYQGMIEVSTDDGISYTMNFRNLKKEDTEKLTTMLESLTEPTPQDAVMQEIVVEQAKKFLMKEQSKEETVDAILQKCNLYLSE